MRNRDKRSPWRRVGLLRPRATAEHLHAAVERGSKGQVCGAEGEVDGAGPRVVQFVEVEVPLAVAALVQRPFRSTAVDGSRLYTPALVAAGVCGLAYHGHRRVRDHHVTVSRGCERRVGRGEGVVNGAGPRVVHLVEVEVPLAVAALVQGPAIALVHRGPRVLEPSSPGVLAARA
eukprot:scaffold46279_cov39-Phaeocystis_antarctica.AAC.2